MKKRKLRQGLAIVLALFMTINYAGSYLGRSPVVSMADTAATVNATSLNVRSGPGTGYSVAGKLSYGASISVTGETTGSDGKVWYQVRFTKNGTQATGYVRSDYIKFPTSYQSDRDFERYLTNQGFPESYKPGLRQLHAEYPNWVFTAHHTNLDWSEVIDNESVVGRNLVAGNSPTSWKSTESGAYNWDTGTWPSFDSGSWVAASREIISYYMDPRNFLNEKYVFQFLRHRYNSNIHTIDGIKNMVQNTFMDNSVDVSGSQSSNSGVVGPGAGGNMSGNLDGSDTGPGVSSGGGPGGGSGDPGTGNTGPGTNNPGTSTGNNSGTVQPGVRPGGGGNTQNNGTTQNTGGSSKPGTSGGSNTQGSGGPGVGNAGTGNTGTGSSGVVQPGVSPGSAHNSQNSGNTGTGNVRTEAPTKGSHSGVSLQSPSASVSTRQAIRVGTAVGPGMSPGGPGVVSQGESAYSDSMASYAEIIMNAATRSGVNPYVLTAMILQEQGTQGSRGVSGKVPGYEGYYNFFNIEAYKSGSMEAIERGLWYASQSGSYERPWNSVDKAILGGAVYYGTNYVNAGQDTFYLKKFNVQGDNLYKHQYMTNVQAAASEGAKLEEAYSSHLKQQALEFKIPVYKNMPDSVSPLPSQDGSPNNKLSSLSVDGFTLSPAFSRETTSYNMVVDPSVSVINVRATALDSKAVISGTGNVQLQSGNQDIAVQVTAQNGTVCRYVIHIVRQNGGSPQGTGQSPGSAGGPGVSQGPGVTADPGWTGGQGTTENSGSQNTGDPGSAAIEIITGGPEQSHAGGSGHTGPGGSNVTIIQ